MRSSWLIAVIVVLCVGAAFQVFSRDRTGVVDPLLPGERLNAGLLEDRTRQTLKKEACFVAWVMDPDCSACKRLAQLQGQRVRQFSGFYWLFAGSDSAVQAFVKRYELSDVQTLRISTRRGNVRDAMIDFGIVATPTRIVANGGSFETAEVRVLDGELLDHPEAIREGVCT